MDNNELIRQLKEHRLNDVRVETPDGETQLLIKRVAYDQQLDAIIIFTENPWETNENQD